MKILTLNFLTCAIKSCKPQPAAFPLHVRDAELELVEMPYNPEFMRNMLGRIEWPALRSVAAELGMTVPASFISEKNDDESMKEADTGLQMDTPAGDAEPAPEPSEEDLQKLHTLLLETQITSGKLVCGNCGHEYKVLEGIPNFLLPAHLV